MTGVTWSITANGNKLISTVFDRAKSIPSKTPPIIANSKEKKVNLIVKNIARINDGPSVQSVSAILVGAGIK